MRSTLSSAALLILFVLSTPTPSAAADPGMTCAEATAQAGGSGFSLSMNCGEAGTAGDGTHETTTTADASQPVGTWIYDGYVCDVGATCSGLPLCSDGIPQRVYVYVLPDGTRADEVTVCPGDPDEPVDAAEAVTPPSPGEIFRAFQEVAPAASQLRVQPPNGKTLVNFETIFSTEAEPFTTGALPLGEGFRVRFDVSAQSFTWAFGDGETTTTDWPGRPWQEGADVAELVTHVYTSVTPVKASVTTSWGATYRLNGGPPLPVQGTVDVTSPEVPLEILEAKPQLVR